MFILKIKNPLEPTEYYVGHDKIQVHTSRKRNVAKRFRSEQKARLARVLLMVDHKLPKEILIVENYDVEQPKTQRRVAQRLYISLVGLGRNLLGL